MKTLSIQRPRPSIEIRMSASSKILVKAKLVNCDPRSVLKISGLPKRAMAFSSAVTQNSASIVLDSRHARTLRLNQSMIATRYRKPPTHRDVGHVCTPDLVRPIDGQMAKQIWPYSMLRMRFTRLRTLVDRRQAHLEHQPTDAMAPNAPTVTPQMPCHLPRAVPRRLQELFVDETHQPQCLFALRRRLTIERRPTDRRKLALAHDREPWMTGIDHRLPPIQAQRSKAFDKKSRSTTS